MERFMHEILECLIDKEAEVVTVPKGFENVPSDVFQDCVNLEKLIFPSGVKEVTIPEICYCPKLREIVISETVEDIQVSDNSRNLERISVSPKNQHYLDDDGVLYQRNGKDSISLLKYPPKREKTNYQVLEGTEVISQGAFKMCQALRGVYLADSVTNVRDEAFWNCNHLEYIYIPRSVVEIGDNALHGTPFLENCQDEFVILGNGILFKYNGSDETVIVPDGVTEVKPMAFFYCRTIKTLIIPETVKKIKDNTFNTCTNLKEIGIMQSDGAMFIWNLETLKVRKHLERALVMIQNHDFATHDLPFYHYGYITPEMKFPCILDYFLDTADMEAGRYISDHYRDFVCQFIQNGDIFHLKRFTKETPYITAENIDTFISYAIDCTQKGGSLEVQMYLMDYKAKYLGYANPEDFFKL